MKLIYFLVAVIILVAMFILADYQEVNIEFIDLIKVQGIR